MSDQRLYEKWLKAKNENYDLKAEIERLRTELEWIRDNAHMGSRDIRQRAEAALAGGEPKWHPEKGKTYEAFDC